MNLKQDYKKVMDLIGYQFNNKELLFQAFKRSSYALEHGGESNEVLEFIGDTTIETCVVRLLIEKFMGVDKELYTMNNLKEFDFTEFKQDVTNNEYLAKVIDKFGLAKYLLLGTSDLKNNISKETKIKADLLEAIIGAITIDCKNNIEKLYKVVINLLDCAEGMKVEERLQIYADVRIDLDNAVVQVKELADKRVFTNLNYVFGNHQEKQEIWTMWSCRCNFNFRKNGKPFEMTAVGYGTTKSEAKKDASLTALKKYKAIMEEK